MFDWMTGLVEAAGPLGIALLMFLENLFPPIPSELIMPLAGYQAARGGPGLVACILAGSAGSLAGAYFWYVVGQRIGEDRLRRLAERHGRWLTLSPASVDRAGTWFRRRGGLAVMTGRLAPAVRTLISVPAGIAAMPRARFLAYSAVGTVAWTAFLTLSGYALGRQHERIVAWLDPVSTAVVVALILGYLWRVVRYRPD